MSGPKIAILLATRNGAQYLQQQLDSFRAQTYPNWELIASDDGSTDGTIDMLERFAASVPQRVEIRKGPQQGFWQNFVALVRGDMADATLFAYSDQDDVWFAEKLANAVAWFEQEPAETPALYFTRTELIASSGAQLGHSPLFVRPPTFRNALVQNIGGGNTMVFNRAALAVLCATPVDAVMVSHDWWTYQMITGVGGTAHYDSWPSLQYRQHGGNLVGGNIGFRARLTRLFAFAGGRVVTWNDVNLKLLDRVRDRLTPDNVIVLDRYARARAAWWPSRMWLFLRSGVYRQTLVENVGLGLGVLFGRV